MCRPHASLTHAAGQALAGPQVPVALGRFECSCCQRTSCRPANRCRRRHCRRRHSCRGWRRPTYRWPSSVCTFLLSAHIVVVGEQTPVHALPTQAELVHRAPAPHVPFAAHVIRWVLSEQSLVVGVHTPPQSLPVQTYMHEVAVPQLPVAEQVCTCVPSEHCVSVGSALAAAGFARANEHARSPSAPRARGGARLHVGAVRTFRVAGRAHARCRPSPRTPDRHSRPTCPRFHQRRRSAWCCIDTPRVARRARTGALVTGADVGAGRRLVGAGVIAGLRASCCPGTSRPPVNTSRRRQCRRTRWGKGWGSRRCPCCCTSGWSCCRHTTSSLASRSPCRAPPTQAFMHVVVSMRVPVSVQV